MCSIPLKLKNIPPPLQKINPTRLLAATYNTLSFPHPSFCPPCLHPSARLGVSLQGLRVKVNKYVVQMVLR